MNIQISPYFGLAVLETVLYSLVLQWMAIKVGMARKKYGVKLPAAYENKEDSIFNRYQRAHQNAVEGATPFYISLLLAALHAPIMAAIAGLIYIVGRVIYCIKYYQDVGKRRTGMFYMFAQLYLYISSVIFGIRLLLQNA